MKLYVKKSNGVVTPLNAVASTRNELATIIGSPWFTISNETFHVNQVYAVANAKNIGPGAIIGGLIGLLLGPEGLIIGGLLGGAIGNEDDQKDSKKVQQFNQSKVL